MTQQDLPKSAPTSPNMKRWSKRIMTVGCAPAMIGGMMAFAAPQAATIGFAVTMLVGLPILMQVFRLRRDNQQRWDEALRQAADHGLKVKPVELESGDLEYRLMSQAALDRERWGDDLAAFESERDTRAAPPESGLDSADSGGADTL